ncbi:MAG: hypothetical protein ABI551_04150 [Polyangiaceae bacterium]
MEESNQSSGPKTFKIVYAVTENKQGKSFWTRIGIAFVNRDGSLNVKLDCVPVGETQMQIRDYEPLEDRPDRANRSQPSRFGDGPTLASPGF